MKATQFLVFLITTALLVFLTWFLFSRGMAIYSLGLLTVPLGILLINKPKLLYTGIIVTPFSSLTLPGLPEGIFLYHVLVLLAFGVYVLDICILKEPAGRRDERPLKFVVGLLLLNFILIIFYRGFGLRFFGGDRWGGMRYLQAMIPMLLLLLEPKVTFTSKEWKKLLVLFLGFSILPALTEILFLVSGGSIYFMYYFIKFQGSTLASFAAQMTDQGLVRFQAANKFAPILVMAAIYIFLSGRTKTKQALGLLFYVTAVFLTGLTGHRSTLIDLVLLSFFGGLCIFWKRKVLYFIAITFSGIFMLICIYTFATDLPISFQRALYILPGIEVQPEAYSSATATMEWRYGVWSEGINELKMNPSYFLLGKGLTFSGSEYMALQLFDFHYWWAVLNSTYHQGFLTLIIVLGIPGTLLFITMQLMGWFHHLKPTLAKYNTSNLANLRLVILVYSGILILKYYFVHGDLEVASANIIYFLFIMKLIQRSLNLENRPNNSINR